MPALVLLLWLVTTLAWWAFAFAPLPSEPPGWLSAARHACFGSADDGLPAPHGWMLLILGPASFLAGILVLWGRELPPSLARAGRTHAGRIAVVTLALAVTFQGVWVVRKMEAARAIGAATHAVQDDGALPVDYVRQDALAPGFSLVDQHDKRLSLAELRGRPVVLTFVFAHCETMCPLIVERLKQASGELADTPVLLVTLDPWRDTPGSLPGIAQRWALPGGFHVLSSPDAGEVLAVGAHYGVTSVRDERTGDITHPGLVFLIDADGRLAYTFSNPPAAWVQEGLRRLGPLHVRAR